MLILDIFPSKESVCVFGLRFLFQTPTNASDPVWVRDDLAKAKR